jgi:hypothetical protein
MLSLRFENPVSGKAETIGPAPYFCVSCGVLRRGPDNSEVALYDHGTWTANGETYMAITASENVRVHFNGDLNECADTYGPFQGLRLVNGAMRAGPDFGDVLAKYQRDSQTWYIYEDEKTCKTATIIPA